MTETPAPTTQAFMNATVTIPAGAAITLTFPNADGAPETLDITGQAAALLALGETAMKSLPADAGDQGVDFARLDCPDEITFTLDDNELTIDEALALMGASVIGAITSYLAEDSAALADA